MEMPSMTIERQIADETRAQLAQDLEAIKQHTTSQMALLLERVGNALLTQQADLSLAVRAAVAESFQEAQTELVAEIDSSLQDDFAAIPGAVKVAIQVQFDNVQAVLASAVDQLTELKTASDAVLLAVQSIDSFEPVDLTEVTAKLDSLQSSLETLSSAVASIDATAATYHQEILDAIAGISIPTDPTDPEPVTTFALVGMNVAGLGNNPEVGNGSLGTHYRSFAYPIGAQPDYLATAYGLTDNSKPFMVRIPFAGERCFTVSNGTFTVRQSYIDEMLAVIRYVASRGGKALLDMHNYCRWWVPTPKNGDGTVKYSAGIRKAGTVGGITYDSTWLPIGHAECPVDYAMLNQMWAKLAEIFDGEEGVWGFGLMNEPHSKGAGDLGVTVEADWVANVQALINAVRAKSDKWVTVAGLGYSTAKLWRTVSNGLGGLVGENIAYEAHQYPDENGGGGGSWKSQLVHTIDPVARVNDWRDCVAWCQEQGRPLIAGEFGCPVEYEKWTGQGFTGTFEYSYTVQGGAEFLEQINEFFDEHNVMRFQWLAGPGDNNKYGNGMDRDDGTLKGNGLATKSRFGLTTTKLGPLPIAA